MNRAAKSERPTTVYMAGRRPDDPLVSVIGRELFPHYVSHSEYEAAGSPISTEPYDVHATSVIGGERDEWLVTVKGNEDQPKGRFTLAMGGGADYTEAYRLAKDVEEHLGRTGLRIVAS
jgi:hypothetical protein